MASLSRTQLIAVSAVPIVVVLVSLGVIASRSRGPGPVDVSKGQVGGARSDTEEGANRPRLAITREGFDGMGKILGGLGEGYRYRSIDEAALLDPKAVEKYSAIFLTCARTEGGAKASTLAPSLRDYVAGGGTLYASDLRFDAIAEAFPNFVDKVSVAQGLRQEIVATVMSPELKDIVGAELPLHFELDGWRPAAFRGDEVDVLIKGKLRTTAGIMIEAPLLVKFPFGKGTVLFTSFHHAKKNSPAEIKLLNQLALKTVLANVEAREVDTMAGDGLSAVALTAIGVEASGSPKVLNYDLDMPGPLQFRVGSDGAADFRLEVVSPAGKQTVKRGESGVSISVADAAPGRWEYRLAAEKVPYPRFPALLIVGAKDSAGATKDRANPTLDLRGGNVRFEEISLGNDRASRSRKSRLAVSDPPNFDDMGRLLIKLGAGYQYAKVSMDDLLRSDGLDGFDIFFLTCNAWPGEWAIGNGMAAGQRQGIVLGRLDPEKMKKCADTVRRFVERGGTLYASDYRIDVLNAAFPERSAGLPHNQRVPARMPRFALNAKVVPKLMTVERAWLDILAPAGHINTMSETLAKIDLSPELKARLDEVVAAVEVSNLANGHLKDARTDLQVLVRRTLAKFSLPASEADVTAVTRAIVDWEATVRANVRQRAAAKTKKLLTDAENELNRQRGRIKVPAPKDDPRVLDAIVEDPGLREVLGADELSLSFNTVDWKIARFLGPVEVLLRADYVTTSNDHFQEPLLVKFREGQGTVIFTSFHNEAQNNQQEEALLRYLVFAAVTAKEEAVADAMMLKGGFSPAKRNQINHMAGNASITRTYDHPGSDPLRFALIFAGADARLRFTIVAPGGRKHSVVVESTAIIEASGAAPGEWTYTVEAIKVPHENFPFGVSIGKGAAPTRGL